MAMNLGGIGANFTVMTQNAAKKSVQAATPTFANNHTWGSIAEMDRALRKYGQEWRGVYSDSFSGSGASGDGKLSREELGELLQSEFGGMGATFVDSAPKEPRAGRNEIYIDEKNLQKMADDPEYRAQVFSVIQIEMAGTRGYSVQGAGGVINDRLTGTALSIADGDPLFEGVPHSGMCVGTGAVQTATVTSGGGANAAGRKSRSVLDMINDRMKERLEEKREKEKKEAAKKAREDMLEVSAEASAKIKDGSMEKVGQAGTDAAAAAEPEAGGALDIIA